MATNKINYTINNNEEQPKKETQKTPANRNAYFKNYMRQYYYKNRQTLINCKFCNKNIMRCSITRHQRSDKCQILQRIYYNV